MSEPAESAQLYSAIEESARLLEVPCSRERVWPILSAYADSLPKAVIALRVATGARYRGDLDWRFTVGSDVDPYAVALSNGLTEKTDHPVGTLLAEISERCPIASYGIDFGVAGGFKKIYLFFPPDGMQSLSTLAELPSMPRSLADNVDLFARRGLGDKVNTFGIDYRHRTVNVYFGGLPDECLEPAGVLSMTRELGLPDPGEQMLRLGRQAFGIYASLGWESSAVERFCFAVMASDSSSLPVPLEPEIEQFLKGLPNNAADSRFVYYAGVSSTGEENYKVQSYYNWQPRMLDQMLLSDSGETRA
ncbi:MULTISPECIES: aromatic prenyltransferase [Micromonospora]|uniref:Aromatic prenyltransferase Orf2 n=1 Tax=Micromonospora rifamycinica TaxID=291594 RepID=A0A109IJR5_9ACTN|nr:MULTISPECIES: aromatic prenyltransferase [Micromonospora]KWV31812.1 prenyltransferase [Micromonospora rifamycinica]WFE62953.1 aromatic prenyltransferase [Micromonospora sp. WMMD714]SCG74586.1 Aromatic prenyltransferase Orf2 [Micromonospora rifamycinica]